MSPLGLWNVEWLNLNSQRSYPLTSDATKKDVTESITLPDDLILALYFPVHAGLDVDPSLFYLQSIAVFGIGVSLTIGYFNDDDNPAVATVSVVNSAHTEGLSYSLSGVGNFTDSIGQIAIGSLAALLALPPGAYVFDYAGGKLEVDCLRPVLRGLSSVVLVNGQDRSPRLYGDIELVAGSNCRLDYTLTDDGAQIQINAIEGEGLTENCECAEALLGPIRTINGIGPDPSGNFSVLGDSCLTVSPATNGLQLSDACSKPCCGCPELTAITTDLQRFADEANTLQGFVTRLQAQVAVFTATVLGAKLNDIGCT